MRRFSSLPWLRILRAVRLALYAILPALVLCLGLPDESVVLCLSRRWFGALCPACGASHAFAALLRLDLTAAAGYNALFTFGVFPVVLLLALEDVYTMARGQVRPGFRRSLVEFLLTGRVN